MKYNLTQVVAFPILIGTMVGILVAILALWQTFDDLYEEEIINVKKDIYSSIESNFSKFEQEIFIDLKRFASDKNLRKAVIEDESITAFRKMINLSISNLPILPSLTYINRNDEVSWLDSSSVFGEEYPSEVITAVENNAQLHSGTIINVGKDGENIFLLVYSTEIPSLRSFDRAGIIRTIYEFGPDNLFFSELRKQSDVHCLLVFIRDVKSKWSGDDNCNAQLENAININNENVRLPNIIQNNMIVEKISALSPSYPGLAIYAAKRTTIRQGQKLQMLWTFIYVTITVFISGIATMFVASIFIRHSSKSLLSFIEKDIHDTKSDFPVFYIKEFHKIAESHLKAKNELLNLNHKLSEINREQAELTYAITHDIKSPIITIQMLLSELEEAYNETLNEDTKDILQDLQSTSERMITLIDSILSYARSVGKVIQYENVDLNHLVSDILSDIKGEIKNTNVEFIIEKLPIIQASEIQMRILLQNLISNAVKFHNPEIKPLVEISSFKQLQKDGNFIHIVIRDNGIGIPKEYHKRIFGLFKRLHNYETYKGSGIGLAVCQRIVRNHKGKIVLQSEEGKGTTFSVVLPS